MTILNRIGVGLVLAIVTSRARGQTDKPRPGGAPSAMRGVRPHVTRVWVSGGLGAGGTTLGGGVGLSGELAFQDNHLVVIARATHGIALDFAGDGGGTGVGDVGMLVGRATVDGPGHAVIATGLGGFYGGCTSELSGRCRTIPSIPLLVEASVHLGPVFALGAQLLGNLNTRAPMYGAGVTLQVGWFGERRR